MGDRRRRRGFVLLGLLVLYIVGTIVRAVIVRCRRGHLFTTTWIPGVSFKSIRLGWWRLQWCPVGAHFSLVRPVKAADLTDDERLSAELQHDVRIP
jgi:hypothetical protein